LRDAQRVRSERKPRIVHYTLTEEGQDALDPLCGGEVWVFIQAFFPPPRLASVGGGHIGRPLKIMSEAAGFEVIVVDVEPGRADVPELEAVDITADSYIVLITTDHVSDEAALRQVLPSPAVYIVMIGSRAKCQTITV
jgi:xanthine dehydrogenase accessory factor